MSVGTEPVTSRIQPAPRWHIASTVKLESRVGGDADVP